jgi:hypothetical protein
MTTCRALLQAAIKAAGGNSLCNPDLACGCDLGDLAPCDSIDLDACQVAIHKTSEPDSEEMANYGLEYYQVI